jgi:hypothetical protein
VFSVEGDGVGSWSCDVNVVVVDSGADADEGMGSSIGSSCLVSLMEMTIFSRSIGVMCFSFPRLRLHSAVSDEELMRGATGDDVSNSSSDEAESKLEERAGSEFISPCCGVAVVDLATFDDREGSERRIEVEGALVGDCDAGAQQNVSRFHNRQLRFSSRFPSSMACDVFEKSDHCENIC